MWLLHTVWEQTQSHLEERAEFKLRRPAARRRANRAVKKAKNTQKTRQPKTSGGVSCPFHAQILSLYELQGLISTRERETDPANKEKHKIRLRFPLKVKQLPSKQ